MQQLQQHLPQDYPTPAATVLLKTLQQGMQPDAAASPLIHQPHAVLLLPSLHFHQQQQQTQQQLQKKRHQQQTSQQRQKWQQRRKWQQQQKRYQQQIWQQQPKMTLLKTACSLSG